MATGIRLLPAAMALAVLAAGAAWRTGVQRHRERTRLTRVLELGEVWVWMVALLFGGSILLASVSCKQPEIRYVRVEVPVAVPCPPPPYLPGIDLPIYHLGLHPTPAEVAKAYADSVTILLGEVSRRDQLLDGYRAAATTKGPR